MTRVSAVDSSHRGPGKLRGDLRCTRVSGRWRTYELIIDEISGRFTRVPGKVWQSLRAGVDDPLLWDEARRAGLTRQRDVAGKRRFSPLFFRVPLGSVDRLASSLARRSDFLFSSTAVTAWLLLIAAALLIVISRLGQIAESFGSLRLFLEQSDPLWILAVFVGTKVLHELAHAAMCRRMGARCGTAGLLVMAGIPCPYCDVTDIWRQPSAAARAAVMFAGIYVELIVAALATLVWFASTQTAIQLAALNVMVVCGVSTIVFNANPLMRYDGYYVLSDLLGSVNLRREAGQAFRAVCTRRFAGRGYGVPRRSDGRAVWLAHLHVASVVYRLLVAVAIGSFLLGVADYFQLRPFAMLAITAMVAMAAWRLTRRTADRLAGGGNWAAVSLRRRGVVFGGLALVALAVLLVPLPRFRDASGWVDAADATSVYVVGRGTVQTVSADLGQVVRANDPLIQVANQDLRVSRSQWNSQFRIAQLRKHQLRHASLGVPAMAAGWKTLHAAEQAVGARLAAAEKMIDELDVRSPIDGVVIPAGPFVEVRDDGSTTSLRDRVGQESRPSEAWCRISRGGKLHAVLVIDARDRTKIVAGTPVRISLADAPQNIVVTTVESVSAIHSDQPSVTRQAAYEVLCRLPTVDDDKVLSLIGKPCRGVFHLPRRSLATDLTDWLGEWFRE